ncbi:MAG: pantoate--beta-alanine ligase [Bdellovibrionales bacterium GWA2_49_15]|nr:MAG: pantoate--beta-alanine ligase [Bdellovibrionales bacterium GWA2_49_15]HAZ11821.1 pantoate--beta-alanine ligase [Bdellovibrionales bacterium]
MVELIRSTAEFKARRASLTAQKIGLVPTMGNLHKGHTSLVQACVHDNDFTIVTIFVNPKQFGPNEDFNRYPRTLEQDLELLGTVTKGRPCLVYAPETSQDIYPPGFDTTISLGELSKPLCGKFRPGHFDGVATVVYRLFSITRPYSAYFGSKDFQQLAIIKRMVLDLDIPIKIISMPTIRDHDGLALSSRNQYLSKEERQLALKLPTTLTQVTQLFKEAHENKMSSELTNFINQSLADPQVEWQYLEILDSLNLQPPSSNTSEWVVAGAMKVGKTRLIDNITVFKNGTA